MRRPATSQRRFRPAFDPHQYIMDPNRVEELQGPELYQMNFSAPGEWGPSGLWGEATRIPGQWTHNK